MAWTEMCKIQFCNTVKTLVAQGEQLLDTLHKFSEQSGIPFSTLKDWWYHQNNYESDENPSQDLSDESDTESQENSVNPDSGESTNKTTVKGKPVKGLGGRPPKARKPETIINNAYKVIGELVGLDLNSDDLNKLSELINMIKLIIQKHEGGEK